MTRKARRDVVTVLVLIAAVAVFMQLSAFTSGTSAPETAARTGSPSCGPAVPEDVAAIPSHVYREITIRLSLSDYYPPGYLAPDITAPGKIRACVDLLTKPGEPWIAVLDEHDGDQKKMKFGRDRNEYCGIFELTSEKARYAFQFEGACVQDLDSRAIREVSRDDEAKLLGILDLKWSKEKGLVAIKDPPPLEIYKQQHGLR